MAILYREEHEERHHHHEHQEKKEEDLILDDDDDLVIPPRGRTANTDVRVLFWFHVDKRITVSFLSSTIETIPQQNSDSDEGFECVSRNENNQDLYPSLISGIFFSKELID